jgi:hypothetical protein
VDARTGSLAVLALTLTDQIDVAVERYEAIMINGKDWDYLSHRHTRTPTRAGY